MRTKELEESKIFRDLKAEFAKNFEAAEQNKAASESMLTEQDLTNLEKGIK